MVQGSDLQRPGVKVALFAKKLARLANSRLGDLATWRLGEACVLGQRRGSIGNVANAAPNAKVLAKLVAFVLGKAKERNGGNQRYRQY